MSKVQSFDASYIMREVSKAAPILLLVCALASFFTVGIFAVDYYENLFQRFGTHSRTLAILIASIQELVRFALLVSSIRDFSDKKKFNGWLGLLGSLALVFHDIGVAYSIAEMWDAANPVPYSTVLIFLILLGLGLEIRLILTVDLNQNIFTKSNNFDSVKNIIPSKNILTEKKPSSNGAHTAANH